MTHDIVKRYSGNPVLTKAEIPYPVETVHNAAVLKHGNEYTMLFRSHLRTGRSIIGLDRESMMYSFPCFTTAAGVPVIAMDLGSCREVIEDGQTGFLVNNVSEAVQALPKLPEIDRAACREHVQQRFSIDTMVAAYERVYDKIFDQETKRRS